MRIRPWGTIDELPPSISQRRVGPTVEIRTPEPTGIAKPRMKETAQRKSGFVEDKESEVDDEEHHVFPQRDALQPEGRRPDEVRTKNREDPHLVKVRLEREKQLKGKDKFQEKGADLAKEALR